ncbi:MAG: hypothetical protein ACWA5A_04935 [Marinibacterium sp.]
MTRAAAPLAVAASLLGLLAGAAQAQSCGAGILMLRCQIGAGKALSVCFEGGSARYRFGPPAAPELSLTQPLEDLQATPWNGIGRSIWEEVIFSNAAVRYAVWTSLDRLDEAHPRDGGVRVLQGDAELANLTCRTGSVEMSAFAVTDGFAAAGYCWDPSRRVWSRSCP